LSRKILCGSTLQKLCKLVNAEDKKLIAVTRRFQRPYKVETDDLTWSSRNDRYQRSFGLHRACIVNLTLHARLAILDYVPSQERAKEAETNIV
jgi:hypothetical protein